MALNLFLSFNGFVCQQKNCCTRSTIKSVMKKKQMTKRVPAQFINHKTDMSSVLMTKVCHASGLNHLAENTSSYSLILN